ncbi:MAG: adenylate kinase [Rickettsiales bacterium]|nr:adenylate kinase [Rickettsiales bacterium]
MFLVLVGAPGAGKGTQGDVIVKEFSITRISTGDLLREEIRKETELGQEVKSILASGQLVSNDIIMSLVKKEIARHSKNGFVLDGVPRTVAQAEEIDQFLLESFGKKMDLVVALGISETKLIKRLSNRFYCKSCNESYNKLYKNPKISGVCDVCGSHDFITRSDDNEEVIKERFKLYESQTLPILSYYKKQKIVLEINADNDVKNISEEIVKEVKNILT